MQNVLSKLIQYVSPTWALKRETSRYMLSNLRAFEGASTAERLSDWKIIGENVNDEIISSLTALRSRSRDLYQNNPWARKIITTITTETVRTGCLITPLCKTQKIDDFETLWKSWSESRACDYTGIQNLYSIQWSFLKTIVEKGECLIRRRYSKPTDQNISGLEIQILGPEFLDHSFHEDLSNGYKIIAGIEFNDSDKIVAYYLFKNNPSSLSFTSQVRVRVEAKDIICGFRHEYPGQIRGVPWLSPVLVKLRDFDIYEDAQLAKQKVSSFFAGFIYTNGTQNLMHGNGKKKPLAMRPGMMTPLEPGEDVRFGDPPKVDGYSEYSKQVLHAIAAGVGIPYIALTSDLSEANYSSFRGSWLEFQRSIDIWRKNIIIDQFSQGIFQWFIESLKVLKYPCEGIYAAHTPARREMIDPTREIPATIQAIRSGITSWSEVQRSQGKSPEDTLEEITKDFEKIDSMGLVLDCDPRKITGAGISQVQGGQ